MIMCTLHAWVAALTACAGKEALSTLIAIEHYAHAQGHLRAPPSEHAVMQTCRLQGQDASNQLPFLRLLLSCYTQDLDGGEALSALIAAGALLAAKDVAHVIELPGCVRPASRGAARRTWMTTRR